MVSISEKIGCVPQTLHEWVKKAEVDSGKRAGVPLRGVRHRHVRQRIVGWRANRTAHAASFSMRWSRRCTIAGQFIAAAWSIIAIVDRNTSLSNTPNASPRPGSSPRAVVSVTATTTLWRRRSMAFTRPRSSIAADRGDRSMPRNTPPSSGSTGSTIADCSSLSATSRPKAEERYYAMLDEPRMAA